MTKSLQAMFKYGLRRYESSLNMQSKQEMSMSRAAHQSCNGFQDTLYIVLRIDISSPYNGDWGFQLKSIVAEFCKSRRKDHEYKRQSRDLTWQGENTDAQIFVRRPFEHGSAPVRASGSAAAVLKYERTIRQEPLERSTHWRSVPFGVVWGKACGQVTGHAGIMCQSAYGQ